MYKIRMKAVRESLILKLDLREYKSLDDDDDDDGGTADLERRLAEGENVFVLRFDIKWENFAHSNFHEGRWRGMIQVGYFGRLVRG